MVSVHIFFIFPVPLPYSLSLSGCIVVSECPAFDVVLRHDYSILHMGWQIDFPILT